MKLNELWRQKLGRMFGSRQSMQSYIPTYSGLKERNFDSSWFSAESTLISASAVVHQSGQLCFCRKRRADTLQHSLTVMAVVRTSELVCRKVLKKLKITSNCVNRTESKCLTEFVNWLFHTDIFVNALMSNINIGAWHELYLMVVKERRKKKKKENANVFSKI